MHRTQKMALTAIMASLSLSLSILKLELPYPILPYLKFDFAEIPVTLVYFLAGFAWSVIAESLHLIGMLARGADPIGATMKFLAVLSMLAGGWFAKKTVRSTIVEFTGATLLRVSTMILANWIYFTLLFPNFLGYAVKLAGGIYLLYIYTAVFNLIHVGVSWGLSWFIYSEVNKRIKVHT